MAIITATPLSLIPQTYFDQNGVPLSLGFVATYQPGTLTKKATYSDPYQNGQNTNPLQLSGAGTAVLYGLGDYRVIISDVDNNLISDYITSAPLDSSAISPAFAPVAAALTLTTARTILGVDAEIEAAIQNVDLLPGPTGPTGPVGSVGPGGPTGSAASTYAPGFNGNLPGLLILPNLNGVPLSKCYIQFGNNTTPGSGIMRIIFPNAFPTACLGAYGTTTDAATGSWWVACTSTNQTGFTAITSSPLARGGGSAGWQASSNFNWWAIGF